MEKYLLFSIIVPVYNAGKVLSECIESVLHQSYQEFELILINDGSVDDSGTICENYARIDSRIKVVHQKNSGQIMARNQGIRVAKGDYICFLDADDDYEPDHLASISKILRETQVDMVIYNYYYSDAEGRICYGHPNGFFPEGLISGNELLTEMIHTGGLNPVWMKAVKTEVVKASSSLEEYDFLRTGEDLLQTLAYLRNTDTIYYTKKPLYYYRNNPEGITKREYPERYRGLAVVRPALYQYMEECGLDTEINTLNFFKLYLRMVSSNIKRICYSKVGRGERRKRMSEIEGYTFVKKARNYLFQCDLAFSDRVVLILFYRHLWSAIRILAKIKMLERWLYRKYTEKRKRKVV